jgi:hypothetical protein
LLDLPRHVHFPYFNRKSQPWWPSKVGIW